MPSLQLLLSLVPGIRLGVDQTKITIALSCKQMPNEILVQWVYACACRLQHFPPSRNSDFSLIGFMLTSLPPPKKTLHFGLVQVPGLTGWKTAGSHAPVTRRRTKNLRRSTAAFSSLYMTASRKNGANEKKRRLPPQIKMPTVFGLSCLIPDRTVPRQPPAEEVTKGSFFFCGF